MTTERVIYNAFLDDLHADWIAVNAQGHPIARAHDEATVRQAAPDAAHYFNAGMLAGHVDGAVGLTEPDPVAAGIAAVAAQSDGAAAFDHDGKDGPGGSMAGDESTAHRGAVRRAAAKAKK